MKRVVLGVVVASALALLVGVAFAQMGWGPMGPGMMGSSQYGYPCGSSRMGPGMMGGQGWAGQLTEENAKVLTQQYVNKYLNGYTVEQVLPFVGMGMTMYQAELKGPNGETRILYINPWGNVMPFSGPQARVR